MFPDLAIAVSDEADAVRAVQFLKAQGADFVKVYSGLSREAYFAVAAAAREQGLRFAGHVPDSISAAEASDAGQASIEHLNDIWVSCSSRQAEIRKQLELARASRNPLVLSRAKREGYALAVGTYSLEKARALFARLALNGTWQVPTLTVTRAVLPSSAALIVAMNREGVRIMAGTDTPNPFVPPGSSLHDELALLVEAGLSRIEALQSATLNPALFLGLSDQLGTVEKGKIADLVLLGANPLDDIRNTRKVVAVIIRGRLIHKSELE